MNGTLYGVGVGPGDPRLMTYLAVDTIKCCPVLAVPADGKGKAVAYRIASGIVKNLDQKECLDLATPMTKDRAVLDAAYQTAADRIIEKLEQGLDVACLTLGDPTIYSTYIYIHRLVKARGYDAKIINGIPSFCAVSARLEDSLADRSEQIHIIPSTSVAARPAMIATTSSAIRTSPIISFSYNLCVFLPSNSATVFPPQIRQISRFPLEILISYSITNLP